MSQCCGSFYERSNSIANKACRCAASAAASAQQAKNYASLFTNVAGGDLTGTYPNPQIAAGAIVDADINSSAAIALSKLATGALPAAITVSSSNIVDGTIVDADINASAAIGLSKLATGALPSAITVSSANIVDGTIVNADVSPTAAIAGTKVNPAFGAQNITTTGTASDYRAIQITNASGVQVQLAANANTSGDLRTTTNHPFTFLTNNTEHMRIEASGNVGIGTESALQRLTAVNTAITGGAPASSGSAADPNAVARLQAGAVALDFGVYPAGQMWLQPRAASNYALNYDLVLQPNGGNVGIGAVSASSKLEVVGDLTLGSTTTATSATAGTNGDVPAQVVGYLVVKINGTSRKIPYYAT